jgi:flagellar basal-body rod modification protein FlgD
MSGSLTSNSSSLTASANSAAAAFLASANASSSSGSATVNGPSPLASLGSNFNQFLQLLLTQVQNQDPTDPTNTDQFTTELVQFTGVQEQVNANTTLTSLMQLEQGSQVLQASGLAGHLATVHANQIALQNSQGEVNFQGTAGQTIAIAIVNAAGQPIYDTTLSATSGQNNWVWNGQDNSGNTVPDGAYYVAVQSQTANGGGAAVPYTITGEITGTSSNNGTTQLQLGALNVNLSALQAVDN